MSKKSTEEKNTSQSNFPPVVAVLGHVDHGKTTLLDTIRKTNIASREHGGITQKIGASEIEVEHEGTKRKITFIDTPGHEAFYKMRGRGVSAADVGLLVVSSVDGVMPQTVESIKLLQDSKIPFIVVFTKSDDPKKLVDKAIKQLLKENVMLENYGGDVPHIEVSAKSGANIKELLDLVLLVFDVNPSTPFDSAQGKRPARSGPFMGIVIESILDQKAGPKASVIIKNGTLKIKDEIYADGVKGKVKGITSASGKNINEAGVGEAVEILGFQKVPSVGSVVSNTPKPSFAEALEGQGINQDEHLPQFPIFDQEDMLSIVLIADSQGSLEAIANSLPEKVKFVNQKTGDVEVSDVLFAKSTGAIVLGFNIKIRPEIVTLAKTEKVLVKNYTIIYEMITEISDFVQGKIEALQEEILGVAKILARFPFEKTEVMGVKVTEGRIAKGDKIRLIRNDTALGESRVNSARQGKDQVSKIEAGNEGGIIISPFLDFTIGDMVISHN